MKPGARVQCRIEGLGTEKLLNEARKRGLTLSKIRRQPGRALTIRCLAREYAAFRALGEEKGFSVSDAQPLGILRLERLLRRRWGLIAGVCLCAAGLIYAMGFIWQVRIEDAGAYAGEVRSYLRELGVEPGLRRSAVDVHALREKLEWRLPRVKWVQVDFSGVALRVRLVEGVPPPAVESAGAPGDVVADQDGVLTRLTVYAGTPVCKAGDTVQAGQVLIRGEERGEKGELVPVKARGAAMARVWLSASARQPLNETLSLPTGRTWERRVLVTPFFSWSLLDVPDYLTWDLDAEETILGGAWLPCALRRERYLEIALEKGPRDPEEVKREAAQAALRALNLAIAGQQVIDKWINYSMIEGDTIEATATAEMLCDIARYQKSD